MDRSSESSPRRIPILFCFRPLTFDLVVQCCAELKGKVVFGTCILSDMKLLLIVGNNLGGMKTLLNPDNLPPCLFHSPA